MAGKGMTSRERVLTAFNHQEPDRIPRDLGGSNNASMHIEAHRNLKKHLGLGGGTEAIAKVMGQLAVVDPRITDMFGIDFLSLETGPPSNWKLNITTDDHGTKRYTDEWGVVRACPKDGFYYDIVVYPLKGATLADLDRYPWPNPLDPARFDGLIERARDLYEGTDKCIVLLTDASIYMFIGFLLGWEEFYRSLVGNQPLIRGFVEHLVDFRDKLLGVTLDRIGKYVHVVALGDDLAHQHGLFSRKQILKDIFIPGYRKIINTIKSRGDIKVMFHVCGASHLVFDELISVGVDAVNPVQVSADGMDDTAGLKKRFGDRLTFWGGGCDTQHVLPHGTPDEVRREARRRIADLAPGGGFIFSAVHNIQRDVPPENVVALYEEVNKWGNYPIREGELRKTLQK